LDLVLQAKTKLLILTLTHAMVDAAHLTAAEIHALSSVARIIINQKPVLQ
jgi:hypothetical protein